MSASARIGEGRYIAPAAIPEQTRTSAHELRTHDGASVSGILRVVPGATTVAFLMHPRQVLKRDAILAHIWGYNYVGDDNVIEVYVRHLREKLGNDPPQLVQTVRGVGYVLRG